MNKYIPVRFKIIYNLFKYIYFLIFIPSISRNCVGPVTKWCPWFQSNYCENNLTLKLLKQSKKVLQTFFFLNEIAIPHFSGVFFPCVMLKYMQIGCIEQKTQDDDDECILSYKGCRIQSRKYMELLSSCMDSSTVNWENKNIKHKFKKNSSNCPQMSILYVYM